MKIKVVLIFVLLVITLGFFLAVTPVSVGQQANVSIKDVDVQLTQTRPPVGVITIREYRITAIVQNTGDTDSVNITVKLRDPEPGLNATLTFQPPSYSLKPNEEKTFVVDNWPTSLSGNIPLNITFQPSSPNVLLNTYNSGSFTYTLHINDTNAKTSTPGFEILIVLLAILTFLVIKKIRR